MNLINFFSRPNKNNFFEKCPDGVLVVSLEGKILDANKVALKMFETSEFEIIGQYFSAYIEGGSNILNKIVTTKTPLISKAYKKNSQDDFYFEISASRDVQTHKVYVTLRDVTQKYKMHNMVNGQYEIAKSIIDGKNNYLVNISGEVLSSLATIEGFSKALSDGVGGVLVDKQMKYVDIINKNAKELMFDLEKLFTIFRLESNYYQFDFRNFDVVNLLNSIAKNYEPVFEQRKMLFEYDFSSLASRACFLDPGVFEYVIRCILDLFLKYTQIGKVIFNVGNPPSAFLEQQEFEGKTSLEPQSYILFEMKASELFLDEDELPRIFDAYTLSDKNKYPTGMRLSFVLLKKFLKSFRGDIWVYSKPSFGTMVSFVVPVDRK